MVPVTRAGTGGTRDAAAQGVGAGVPDQQHAAGADAGGAHVPRGAAVGARRAVGAEPDAEPGEMHRKGTPSHFSTSHLGGRG